MEDGGQNYSREELIELGFEQVGTSPKVSRDARFFAIRGSLGDAVRIDAYAVLTGHVELGNQVHISLFCFLGGTGGKIWMEDESGLSTHVSVFTKSDDYTRSTKEKVTGSVHIQSGAIIGSGTRVLPGVTIGKMVSVGCNSVINKDLEDGIVVVNRGIGLVTVNNRLCD